MMGGGDRWRGHRIYVNQGKWYYEDGQSVADDPNRPCGWCGLPNTPDGHDGCLGEIVGVANACCGHGDPTQAYIEFIGGERKGGLDCLRRPFTLIAESGHTDWWCNGVWHECRSGGWCQVDTVTVITTMPCNCANHVP